MEKQTEVGSAVRIFYALVTLVVSAVVAFFVYQNVSTPDAKYPFKLGLDLSGGSHLVYEADVTGVDTAEIPELMDVLRLVIERRVNIFGVSEPIVQVESSSVVSGERKERLVVELPGITDVGEAVAEIGRTPLLEFKLVDEQALAAEQVLAGLSSDGGDGVKVTAVGGGEAYTDTGLTGRYLQNAQLQFVGQGGGGLSNEAVVAITWNEEGAALFEKITGENVGKPLAIFLDGELISSPNINERISGGQAVISGGFTPDEARDLAQNLSFGALPLPISLESTQTIGATLGGEILDNGVKAGVAGFILVVAFMVLWYRLPGLVAVAALGTYVVVMLALFQLIPVVLTAAGLAGFILTIGMAVDANVLVFERMKEELREGKTMREAARIGFQRAWSAIRDGNVTSLLSAIVLFWFGTSMVKGFALVFGIGVLVSMLSALLVTRTLLLALPDRGKSDGLLGKLYDSGFGK
jgi:protein-export membrane protein SecD